MYTPRYLSQYDQAKLLARLEALESEVAALHRDRREKRPQVDAERTGAEIVRAINEAHEREKRERDEAARRDFIERGLIRKHTHPLEDFWKRQYGPQPTLMGLDVGTPSETARTVRFAPGTPSERTVTLPKGARVEEMFINGKAIRSPFLRNPSGVSIGGIPWHAKSTLDIMEDVMRGKKMIEEQSTLAINDRLDSLLFSSLARGSSQEIKRPKLVGRKANLVIQDDVEVENNERPSPEELEATRQAIMDSARAKKERK